MRFARGLVEIVILVWRDIRLPDLAPGLAARLEAEGSGDLAADQPVAEIVGRRPDVQQLEIGHQVPDGQWIDIAPQRYLSVDAQAEPIAKQPLQVRMADKGSIAVVQD